MVLSSVYLFEEPDIIVLYILYILNRTKYMYLYTVAYKYRTSFRAGPQKYLRFGNTPGVSYHFTGEAIVT